MVNQIACYLVKKMKNNKVIDENDMDLYVFGVEIFLITLIKALGIFIIASLLGLLKEAIAFISAFSTLRMQAGGVHLKSFWQCFIVTNIIIFSCIFLTKILPINHTLIYQIIILVISIILVLVFAPVDTENKPLNELEKKSYRKRSICIIIIGSIIIISFGLLHDSFVIYGNIVSLGFFSEGITLLPLLKKSANNKKQEVN